MKQRLPATYTKVALSKMTVPSFNGTFVFGAHGFYDPMYGYSMLEFYGSQRVKQFKGIASYPFLIVDVPKDLYDCPADFDETFNLTVRWSKDEVTYRYLLNDHWHYKLEVSTDVFGWFSDRLFFDKYTNQLIESEFFIEVWPKPWAFFNEGVYCCNGLDFTISTVSGNDIVLVEDTTPTYKFPITL